MYSQKTFFFFVIVWKSFLLRFSNCVIWRKKATNLTPWKPARKLGAFPHIFHRFSTVAGFGFSVFCCVGLWGCGPLLYYDYCFQKCKRCGLGLFGRFGRSLLYRGRRSQCCSKMWSARVRDSRLFLFRRRVQNPGKFGNCSSTSNDHFELQWSYQCGQHTYLPGNLCRR